MRQQAGTPAALLAGAWDAWAVALGALGPGAVTAATRCAGWSVHALAAHVAPDPAVLAGLPSMVLDRASEVDDAAALLRRFNDPAGGVAHELAPVVADAAVAGAAATPVAALVERFRSSATVVRALSLDPTAVVPHPVVGSVTVGVLTDVSLVEAVVHHLDLVAAVGGAGPGRSALAHVRDVLVRICDPVAFVDAATGRTGPASVLPLLR